MTIKDRKEENVTLQYSLLRKNNDKMQSLKIRVQDAIMHGDEIEEHKDGMTLVVAYQAVLEDIILLLAKKDLIKVAWEMLQIMCTGVEQVREAKVTLKSDFEAIRMKGGTKAHRLYNPQHEKNHVTKEMSYSKKKKSGICVASATTNRLLWRSQLQKKRKIQQT